MYFEPEFNSLSMMRVNQKVKISNITQKLHF